MQFIILNNNLQFNISFNNIKNYKLSNESVSRCKKSFGLRYKGK